MTQNVVSTGASAGALTGGPGALAAPRATRRRAR